VKLKTVASFDLNAVIGDLISSQRHVVSKGINTSLDSCEIPNIRLGYKSKNQEEAELQT
jgi:hypothetical protein